MRKMRFFVIGVSLLLAISWLSGCGGYTAAGPVTAGNIINDTPPKIRGKPNVNSEASLLVVDFQPFDGTAKVQGWFFAQNDQSNRRELRFQNPVIQGKSTMTGRANFVMDSSSPILPGITFFFSITVEEPDVFGGGIDRRIKNEIWQYRDGVVSRVS